MPHVFSNSLFYCRCYLSCPVTLCLSHSLSFCLSAVLLSPLLNLFDIKNPGNHFHPIIDCNKLFWFTSLFQLEVAHNTLLPVMPHCIKASSFLISMKDLCVCPIYWLIPVLFQWLVWRVCWLRKVINVQLLSICEGCTERERERDIGWHHAERDKQGKPPNWARCTEAKGWTDRQNDRRMNEKT